MADLLGTKRADSSVAGFGGPADSRSEKGIRRGNDDQSEVNNIRYMKGLRSSGGHQHLNDDRDLDHPFERILVDTAVAPDPTAVSWIDPRLAPGETRAP